MGITRKENLQLYQLMVIFSVLFTLVGFSYNVWRMEVTEENNNIRTACFEMLLELSKLEQLVYSAHYDNDLKEGSPRKGWVKVGLISDLSILTTSEVKKRADQLKSSWSDNWKLIITDVNSVNKIVMEIDVVRQAIKNELGSLK